jgi:hypothetical protein
MTRAPVRVHVPGGPVVRVVPVLRYKPRAGSGPDAGAEPAEEAWRADWQGQRATAATPLEAATRVLRAL